MPLEWTFADVWEAVAETLPGAIAQVHTDRRDDWRSFDRRADAIAACLLAAGLGRHDKVALYLPATFQAMVRKQLDVWGEKVKIAGIQPE